MEVWNSDIVFPALPNLNEADIQALCLVIELDAIEFDI